MTTFDTDPNTQTIAAAWSSSELGQPEREVRYGFAAESAVENDDARPVARHAILAAAIGCGIGAGAAVALMLFEFDAAQPTVVVPAVGTSPEPAVFVTEALSAPSPKTVVHVEETATENIVTALTTEPSLAGPGTPLAGLTGLADVGTSHGRATFVGVDVVIPELPPLQPKPEQPMPEPADPPQPKPEPKPEPADAPSLGPALPPMFHPEYPPAPQPAEPDGEPTPVPESDPPTLGPRVDPTTTPAPKP